jgi:hypothetical protein
LANWNSFILRQVALVLFSTAFLSCKTRTFKSPSLTSTQIRADSESDDERVLALVGEENRHKLTWRIAAGSSFRDLALFQLELKDSVRKFECRRESLQQHVLAPILKASLRGDRAIEGVPHETLLERFHGIQKTCLMGQRNSFQLENGQRLFQIFKESKSQDEVQSRYESLVKQRLRESHPLSGIPPGLENSAGSDWTFSYRGWFEHIRRAQELHYPFFQWLQDIESEVTIRILQAAPSALASRFQKAARDLIAQLGESRRTADGVDRLLESKLKSWENEEQLLSKDFWGFEAIRIWDEVFKQELYALFSEEEARVGITVKAVSSSLTSEQFFQMISDGILPHDTVFDVRNALHPPSTHRLQFLAVFREWRKYRRDPIDIKSCQQLNYKEPLCAQHLYRIFSAIHNEPEHVEFQHQGEPFDLLKRYHNELHPITREVCCVRDLQNVSRSNLWTPLFDLPISLSKYDSGYHAPDYYQRMSNSLPAFPSKF